MLNPMKTKAKGRGVSLPETVWTRVDKRVASLNPWVKGLFVGLRPTEVSRLDWSSVRLDAERPHVVVDAAASKVLARRIVPLQPVAVAWLRLDALGSGPICCPQSSTRMRGNARRAGIQWPPDVLRHTYASMRYASGIGAAQLSQEMGNSEAILFRHYREVVQPEEAATFWSIPDDNTQQLGIVIPHEKDLEL